MRIERLSWGPKIERTENMFGLKENGEGVVFIKIFSGKEEKRFSRKMKVGERRIVEE